MATLADVFEGRARWSVIPCDCRFGMSCMPDASVDAVVCDPPYEINFMNRRWDATGVAFDPDTWRHALRVLKPGGHLLAFGGSRTFHRIAVAIEDAGFEIRDSIAWLYSTGFPKSRNVSKDIDAALGAERPIVGIRKGAGSTGSALITGLDPEYPATAAATAAEGYGTALKPAQEIVVVAQRPLGGMEHICLARKPPEGTIASNWMKHGTGALNVNGCRIGWLDEQDRAAAAAAQRLCLDQNAGRTAYGNGRWPANVALTHADGCERVGTRAINGGSGWSQSGSKARAMTGANYDRDPKPDVFAPDGVETVAAWHCVPGCPVAELDAQSGDRPGMSGGGVHRADYAGGMFGAIDCPGVARGDSGGASRFFYTSKAPRAERDAGLDEFEVVSRAAATDRQEGSAGAAHARAGAGGRGGSRNTHSTVKPVDLMRWLVRLVTRPGSIVLDPFCGSGTTGVATMREGEGRRFIGLELEPLHVDFARARIVHVVGGVLQREVKDAPVVKPVQVSIFEAMGGDR